MKISAKEILRRFGAGESIAKLCDTAGLSRAQFDSFRQSEIRLALRL
jgi:hypothetical protein